MEKPGPQRSSWVDGIKVWLEARQVVFHFSDPVTCTNTMIPLAFSGLLNIKVLPQWADDRVKPQD